MIARRQPARLCLLIVACAGMLTAWSQDDVGSATSAHDPVEDAISLENLQQSIADFSTIDDPSDVPVTRWLVPEELDAVLRSLDDEGFAVAAPPATETSFDTWETAPYRPFSDVIGLVRSNERMAALEGACPQIAPAAVLWDGVAVGTTNTRSHRHTTGHDTS